MSGLLLRLCTVLLVQNRVLPIEQSTVRYLRSDFSLARLIAGVKNKATDTNPCEVTHGRVPSLSECP